MLVRTANSETGSTDAHVKIDATKRIISGSVTSGNFCGYLGTTDRRSYYTLYFVAHFDAPFLSTGTWQDTTVRAGTTEAPAAQLSAPKGSSRQQRVRVDGWCSTRRGPQALKCTWASRM